MIASSAALPSPVQAEDWLWTRGEVDVKNRLRRHHGGVGAELATFAGDSAGGGRALLQSPVVGFWYALGNHFTMSLDWGMAYYRENVGGNATRTFRFGAPYLAGYYVGQHRHLKLRLGVALGIPAATLPDGGAREFAQRAYLAAAASRGGWNIWMWIPEAATLAFPARFELTALPHLLLAADVTMGIPIFLHGQGAGFALQFAGDIGYKSKLVSLGARLSHLWWASDTPFLDGGFFQMALEPFLRFDFGKPFLQARLTMNLNNPWGYSFDGGGIWGFHIGGGTQF